jgi:hypothetical protein
MRNSKGHGISTKLRVKVVTIISVAASLQEMHNQHAHNLKAHELLVTTVPERKPKCKPELEPKREPEHKPESEPEHEPESEPETEQQMRKRMQFESEEYTRSRGMEVKEPFSFSYQKLTPVSAAASSLSVVAGSHRK